MPRQLSVAPLAVTALLCVPLAAQRDLEALAALESITAREADRLAPMLVRIETFGGVRRVLAEESTLDRIGAVQPSKMDEAVLRALLDKADRYELDQVWEELGLPPRPLEKPFEVEELRRLGDAELDRLCRKYQVGPHDPAAAKEEGNEGAPKNPRPGLLQQPGFLQAQGASTGILISADGWIVTSRFALNFDPSTILVTLADGRTFTARRAGEDTSRGIALLRIDATELPHTEFADPSEARVGQRVIVLGRTFASKGRPTVNLGIVSACGRIFGRALQIDALTSPANYGGAVVDLAGRVLGVAVPLSPSGRDAGVDWYDSGIGFATTVADIEPLIIRMQRGETLHRAWLGVSLDQTDLGPGAVVAGLAIRSPASRAKLRVGDRVLAVDNAAIHNGFTLQSELGRRLAGDSIALKLRRGETTLEITLELAASPRAERTERSRSDEVGELPWEGDQPKADGERR
ncbi:MAG: S1C family serine protease [Planctomycetota bacterium]